MTKNEKREPTVIDLLSDSDDDGNDERGWVPPFERVSSSSFNTKRKRNRGNNNHHQADLAPSLQRRNTKEKWPLKSNKRPALQAAVVLEEDVQAIVSMLSNTKNVVSDYSTTKAGKKNANSDETEVHAPTKMDLYTQQQQERIARGQRPMLFHDDEFESCPSSIQGKKQEDKKLKCYCSKDVVLNYITRGKRKGQPYYQCPKTGKNEKCRFFRWAFQAEKLQWYRFGAHTGHEVVKDTGFSANDLLQGKVGDCWFLSALAVIAERHDLIQKLVPITRNVESLAHGIVQVNLFLDGQWRAVVVDNFLPCMIDDQSEQDLQQAMKASAATTRDAPFQGRGYTLNDEKPSSSITTAIKTDDEKNDGGDQDQHECPWTSSKYDPFVMSDKNRQVLADMENFLRQKGRSCNPYATKEPITNEAWLQFKKKHVQGIASSSTNAHSEVPPKLNRLVTTDDMAYSKAKNQQLWVPLLEKAYAKSHGSYQAISGGHIAEAFLDLTGAPTLVCNLHNDPNFDPRSFWYKLMSYRQQRLPMGCGTSNSAGGIIGMHAYSILDVREIRNVGLGFFSEQLANRTLGNVSGFTEFDGTVRLIRIRNPHGKGEWKGDFSDSSQVWEKLLHNKQHKSVAGDDEVLERTMKDDGTFWMDYDSFLQGFSNVDVVLAFRGNHAKSFKSSFPEKQSPHRCSRAFEVSMLDGQQPGVPSQDTVELYVMGIQMTKRGASHGRDDRKVSYKFCDMGILVGESDEEDNEQDVSIKLTAVQGEMFGFKRNGHYRLILNRRKAKRLIVMPISFGHPAATDKNRSFVLRFVGDQPLLIRELPQDQRPLMHQALYKYCFGRRLNLRMGQRVGTTLFDDTASVSLFGEPQYRVIQIDCLANEGGVVFVYLCINDRLLRLRRMNNDSYDADNGFSLRVELEATCRGMLCRTENGLLNHETIAKGKKYQANWRKYKVAFPNESSTRLLMVLVQSGQDSEMGASSCHCRENATMISSPSKKKKQTLITTTGGIQTARRGTSQPCGIFSENCNGDDKNENSHKTNAEIFGSSVANADAIDDPVVVGDDFELERALAVSKGDHELQAALEISKGDRPCQSGFIFSSNDFNMTDEQAMQLALERSMRTESVVHFSTGQVVDADEDEQLREAIKRSLQTTKAPVSFLGQQTGNDIAAVDASNETEGDSKQQLSPEI